MLLSLSGKQPSQGNDEKTLVSFENKPNGKNSIFKVCNKRHILVLYFLGWSFSPLGVWNEHTKCFFRRGKLIRSTWHYAMLLLLIWTPKDPPSFPPFNYVCFRQLSSAGNGRNSMLPILTNWKLKELHIKTSEQRCHNLFCEWRFIVVLQFI